VLLERLLDNLALSVEAFATCHVAPGWRLRLPPLDWVTFHYVVAGEGAVRDGEGTDRQLPAGSLAIAPPHVVHSLQCGLPPFGEAMARGAAGEPDMPDHRAGPTDIDGPLVVVCGRLEVTYGGGLGLFDQLDNILVLDFSEDRAMRRTFDAMLQEVNGGRPGARTMTSTLMRECLIRVFRVLCLSEECSVSWLRALDDPALSPVLEAMLSRPADPHTVESLARKAFMSRSAFARRFKTSLGKPPLEYLRGVRLRHAAQLLKKSPPLAIPTVAERSGFASRSQFSRAFRNEFGLSPAAFRSSPA
jgi:AraC-like DNA-binding protein